MKSNNCGLDGANPTALDDISVGNLSPKNVQNVKNIYCDNYNNCLTVAVKEDWAGFDCRKCSAFRPISWYQRAVDNQGLFAAYEASGYVLMYGNSHRKVGVKPGGSSSRNKKRLPVIANRAEGDCDIEVLRKAVIG